MTSMLGNNIETLIQNAKLGDAGAVNELVNQYRAYLKLLARLHVGRNLQSKLDESDVVQETAICAANGFGSFQGQSEHELTAWLRGILANVASKMTLHFHRQRRDVRLETALADEFNRSSLQIGAALCSDESSPSERSSRRERAVIIADALQKLPVAYREVLILRQFEGLTINEIGDRMDRTGNSVQKLWVRALLRMRSLLKEFDERS